MKIGGVLAFALGETLSCVYPVWGGLVGKCNACFRDSPQLLVFCFFFISLRDGYRDLCRHEQLTHPAMIDDVCCAQASVFFSLVKYNLVDVGDFFFASNFIFY